MTAAVILFAIVITSVAVAVVAITDAEKNPAPPKVRKQGYCPHCGALIKAEEIERIEPADGWKVCGNCDGDGCPACGNRGVTRQL